MKKLISCLALSAVMLTSSATAIFSYAEGGEVGITSANAPYSWTSPEYYPEKDGDLTKAPAFIVYDATSTAVKLYVVTDRQGDDGELLNNCAGYGTYDPEYGYFGRIQIKVHGVWVTVGCDIGGGMMSPFVIDNLKPYTDYTVRICMPFYGDYNNNEKGKLAYTNAITVRTTPEKTKITSASRTKNAVRINWKKVNCAGYKVKMYDSKKKVWRTVKTVRDKNVTTARISGLKKNTKYQFYVQPYGRTLKKYPVMVDDPKSAEYSFNYSHTLWGGMSDEKTVRTKK